NLNQANIPLSVSTRSAYVTVDEYGRKLTSDTGQGDWKHKESQSKTVYSIDDAGNVVTQFYDSTGTPTENLSRYKTNIILELPSDDTVKNAAQALANKHPENSYIAKIDANGIIRVYNLNGNEVNLGVKGRYRINVVGHGSKMRTLGAQTLTQHIKNLQTQLKIDPKEEGRIGLVGCETSIKPSANVTSLTETVARNLYSDGMTNLQITGRTAEIEVNDNGTKTMLTGGKKTVYSWDGKQGVIESTEEVKQTADKLNNPLDDFDKQIRIVENLMQKKGPKSKRYLILLNTINAFIGAELMNLTDSCTSLQQIELVLRKYLIGLESEIRGQLEALLKFTSVQIIKIRSELMDQNIQIGELKSRFSDIMNNHTTLDIRLQEASAFHDALLEHEKQGAKYKNHQDVKELYNKTLQELSRAGEDMLTESRTLLFNGRQGVDVDLKIRQLEQAQKNVNELGNYLKYYQDSLIQKITKLQLQITPELARVKLKKWEQFKVEGDYKTTLVEFDHVVVMQLEDDSTIAEDVAGMLGKYFGDSTLVCVDKKGNSLVTYGTPLEQIKGRVKIIVHGHGNDVGKMISHRNASAVADHIVDLKKKLVLVKKESITEVSIKGCNPGSNFGKEVAIELNKEGIQTSVSSRLTSTRATIDNSGRRLSEEFYHSNARKSVWSWDDQGNIFKEKISYPNTNYHAILSIDAKGLPNVEKKYQNLPLSTFKDGLKVFVKAGKYQETLQMLLTFEKQLKTMGAPPMKQINIKMGKNEVDWIGNPANMFSYGELITQLSKKTNANIVSSSDFGRHEGTMVSKYTTKPGVTIITTPKYGIAYKNRVVNNISLQHTNYGSLFIIPTALQTTTGAALEITVSEGEYDTKRLLSELDTLKDITNNHSFSEVKILMEVNQNHPVTKEQERLTGYLSKKFGMNVSLFCQPPGAANYTRILSKTPADFDVIALDFSHLAETTPHQDKNLQDWSPLNDDQQQKLKTESQKTKPNLANHDHQIILQTEDDKNVRQSTLDLACKHPTQTTIIQIDKNGTHQVVYGPKLQDIKGQVKMVTVGYGREKDSAHTLGGRTPDELSNNLIKLNQDLNQDNAKIKHLSVVGCNLDSDNPTDNHNSNYGVELLTKLNQAGIPVSVSTRSAYVAVDEYGRKLTSDTGKGDWKHKESQSKTVYSIDDAGNVVAKFYDSTGTLTENPFKYKTNIIFQLSKNETVKNAAQALANKHPENSYIAKIDADGTIKVYDLNGNEVSLSVKGRYRINVVGHGSEMRTLGTQALTQHIQNLQTQLNIEKTAVGRIGLVGCETDKTPEGSVTSLTKSVAERLYDNGNGTTKVEVTGRTAQIEVNDDGTKTIKTGGTKTVYSWDTDAGKISQKTEVATSHRDVLKNPLDEFDEEINEIQKLLAEESIDENTKKILTNVLEHYEYAKKEISYNDFDAGLSSVERGVLKLQNYLNEYPDTKIKKQLNQILNSTQVLVNDLDLSLINNFLSEIKNILLTPVKDGVEMSKLSRIIGCYDSFLTYKGESLKRAGENNLQKIKELQSKFLEEIKNIGLKVLDKANHTLEEQKSFSTNKRLRLLTQLDDSIVFLKKYSSSFDSGARDTIRQLEIDIPLHWQQAKLQEHEDRLTALKAWQQDRVVDTYKTPLVGFDHVVIMQLEDDSTIAKNSADFASKNFEKYTLVQVDKWGNFQVIGGEPLDKVEGKVKVILHGHGSKTAKTISGRNSTNIVDHIVDLKKKLVSNEIKTIGKVSIKGCNPGPDFGKEVAIGLYKKGIQTSVSSRLDSTRGATNIASSSGRRLVGDYYQANSKKVVWTSDAEGNVSKQVNAYTNTNYHAVLSIDKNGNPDIEKTFEERPLSSFKDGLKILVKAGNHTDTLTMLEVFEKHLQKVGAPPMKQINIKMGEGQADWIGSSNTLLSFGKLTENFSNKFQSNIRLSSDSGPHEGTAAFKYIREAKDIIHMVTPKYSVSVDDYSTDSIGVSHKKNSINDTRTEFLVPSSKLKTDTILKIYIDGDNYSTKELLLQLDNIKEITGKHSFSEAGIYLRNTKKPTKKHEELTGYLSKKLNIRVALSCRDVGVVDPTKVLTKNPSDPDVTVLDLSHLADLFPYQDKNLQSWSDLSNAQHQKLKTESEKTKPNLANHDHQIILQT
ncbi:MAG: hypothetical protein FE834_00920, partial [Gammaproteobacteria bacterium]|nr:hypothetical protein [Gammaproteobacteria bacterium]